MSNEASLVQGYLMGKWSARVSADRKRKSLELGHRLETSQLQDELNRWRETANYWKEAYGKLTGIARDNGLKHLQTRARARSHALSSQLQRLA